MLWTVAVESTHSHPNAAEGSSCSICVVAHTASPAVSSAGHAPVLAAVGVMQEEAVLAKSFLDSFHLSNRGPPAL